MVNVVYFINLIFFALTQSLMQVCGFAPMYLFLGNVCLSLHDEKKKCINEYID